MTIKTIKSTYDAKEILEISTTSNYDIIQIISKESSSTYEIKLAGLHDIDGTWRGLSWHNGILYGIDHVSSSSSIINSVILPNTKTQLLDININGFTHGMARYGDYFHVIKTGTGSTSTHAYLVNGDGTEITSQNITHNVDVPVGIAFDAVGRCFITDFANPESGSAISIIDTDGMIQTVTTGINMFGISIQNDYLVGCRRNGDIVVYRIEINSSNDITLTRQTARDVMVSDLYTTNSAFGMTITDTSYLVGTDEDTIYETDSTLPTVKIISSNYDMEGIISKESSSEYHTLKIVEKTIPSSYEINGAIINTTVSNYDVKEIVPKEIRSTYDIREIIESETSSNYTIKGIVPNEISSSYEIQGIIPKEISSSYDTIEIISKEIQSTYVVTGYSRIIYDNFQFDIIPEIVMNVKVK